MALVENECIHREVEKIGLSVDLAAGVHNCEGLGLSADAVGRKYGYYFFLFKRELVDAIADFGGQVEEGRSSLVGFGAG